MQHVVLHGAERVPPAMLSDIQCAAAIAGVRLWLLADGDAAAAWLEWATGVAGSAFDFDQVRSAWLARPVPAGLCQDLTLLTSPDSDGTLLAGCPHHQHATACYLSLLRRAISRGLITGGFASDALTSLEQRVHSVADAWRLRAVLHERGLSTQGESPTLLTREGVVEADLVITMGCGEACPYVPGKRIVDWELDDPKGQALDTVRRIVDEIDARVQALLLELGVGASQPQ